MYFTETSDSWCHEKFTVEDYLKKHNTIGSPTNHKRENSNSIIKVDHSKGRSEEISHSSRRKQTVWVAEENVSRRKQNLQTIEDAPSLRKQNLRAAVEETYSGEEDLGKCPNNIRNISEVTTEKLAGTKWRKSVLERVNILKSSRRRETPLQAFARKRGKSWGSKRSIGRVKDFPNPTSFLRNNYKILEATNSNEEEDNEVENVVDDEENLVEVEDDEPFCAELEVTSGAVFEEHPDKQEGFCLQDSETNRTGMTIQQWSEFHTRKNVRAAEKSVQVDTLKSEEWNNMLQRNSLTLKHLRNKIKCLTQKLRRQNKKILVMKKTEKELRKTLEDAGTMTYERVLDGKAKEAESDSNDSGCEFCGGLECPKVEGPSDYFKVDPESFIVYTENYKGPRKVYGNSGYDPVEITQDHDPVRHGSSQDLVGDTVQNDDSAEDFIDIESYGDVPKTHDHGYFIPRLDDAADDADRRED